MLLYLFINRWIRTNIMLFDDINGKTSFIMEMCSEMSTKTTLKERRKSWFLFKKHFTTMGLKNGCQVQLLCWFIIYQNQDFRKAFSSRKIDLISNNLSIFQGLDPWNKTIQNNDVLIKRLGQDCARVPLLKIVGVGGLWRVLCAQNRQREM